MSHAILLISCPDRKGITAAITGFISEHNGNIIHADQHIDDQTDTFFMRLEWDLEDFNLDRDMVYKEFSELAKTFSMDWRIFFSDEKPKIAIFASQHIHCLQDLLLKHKAGHLPCDIGLIVSNHMVAQPLAEEFKISFECVEITKNNKMEMEKKEIALLRKHDIGLIILARYHQIFTRAFVEQFPQRIINIHHSFLPAFPGKQPYARAYEKGVKIIGATSHFVTEELDEGPIIAQDTVEVSHRDALLDLIRKGEDLEKSVLARAVRWALEHKILCYGNKTVVFD